MEYLTNYGWLNIDENNDESIYIKIRKLSIIFNTLTILNKFNIKSYQFFKYVLFKKKYCYFIIDNKLFKYNDNVFEDNINIIDKFELISNDLDYIIDNKIFSDEFLRNQKITTLLNP